MERASVIPRVGAAKGPRRRSSRRPAGLWADMLATWLERGRQRRALRRLDDRMLKDVGLSRADVEYEAGKPFWRP